MSNPFCHIELNTDDLAKAKKFYKSVFDWKLNDMPMPGMPYTMIDVGKGTGGGMQKKPMAEAPTSWLAYVEVDSVQKALTKAQKAGAHVVQPYMPIGSSGAIGVFIDPTGAALGVWEPGKKAAPAKKKAAAAKRSAAPAKKKAGKKK